MSEIENEHGLLQPRCPRCGWLGTPWLDVPENRPASRSEVVAHKAECDPRPPPTAPCVCNPAEVENGVCLLCGKPFLVGGVV